MHVRLAFVRYRNSGTPDQPALITVEPQGHTSVRRIRYWLFVFQVIDDTAAAYRDWGLGLKFCKSGNGHGLMLGQAVISMKRRNIAIRIKTSGAGGCTKDLVYGAYFIFGTGAQLGVITNTAYQYGQVGVV